MKTLSLLAVGLLSLGINTQAKDAALPASTSLTPSQSNHILLKATSPFEDMVEFALEKDAANVGKTLQSADAKAPKIREALSPAEAKQFDLILKDLHTAQAAKNFQAVASHGVDAFGLILNSLDPSTLQVPKEVQLLDYAGFRLHVLTSAPTTDWKAIDATIEDATKWWKATKPKVKSSALRDSFDSTIRGLQEAGKLKHIPMINFAAQMDLDIVDLLEHYFRDKK